MGVEPVATRSGAHVALAAERGLVLWRTCGRWRSVRRSSTLDHAVPCGGARHRARPAEPDVEYVQPDRRMRAASFRTTRSSLADLLARRSGGHQRLQRVGYHDRQRQCRRRRSSTPATGLIRDWPGAFFRDTTSSPTRWSPTMATGATPMRLIPATGSRLGRSHRRLQRFYGCQSQDSSWHGTSIAGIIAANSNDDIWTAGIDWVGQDSAGARARQMRRFFESDIFDGIAWAAGLARAGRPANLRPRHRSSI